MKRASLAAALAASMILAETRPANAVDDRPFDEAVVAEQGVLGDADEETRFLDCLPFTRQIAREITQVLRTAARSE